jgi:hypothetical protein
MHILKQHPTAVGRFCHNTSNENHPRWMANPKKKSKTPPGCTFTKCVNFFGSDTFGVEYQIHNLRKLIYIPFLYNIYLRK